LRRALLLAVTSALALSLPAAAQQALGGGQASEKRATTYDPTKPYPPYTAPRLKIGQPDLGDVWSNSTLTSPTRPRTAGDRVAWTEEEVTKMEQAVVQEVIDGNQPTDPNAPVEDKEADKKVRPEFAAAGGGTGGYNRGWLDPGNHVMRVNGQPRTSLLTTPNGQTPPAKAGAPAQTPDPAPAFYKLLGESPTPRGGMFDNPEGRGSERCITSFGRNGPPPMFANGFYNNNYQFVQSPDHILIDVEMIHDARIIRLNSKHRTDGIRPYFGDSIGWWEGDTLVVETTNLPQSQGYGGSWKNLKVTERFKRVAEDRLLYQFSIEDKDRWDQPWGGEYEFHPLVPARLYEYACHEGNYALHGVLAGGRADDAKKAAKEAEAAAAAKKGGKAPAKPAAVTPPKN
jgi:hypothetical protein